MIVKKWTLRKIKRNDNSNKAITVKDESSSKS